MKIIVCQPDSDYYVWQLRVQLIAFQRVDYLKNVLYLFAYDTVINPKSTALVKEFGIDARWYQDTREDKIYPPSVTFFLLSKYFAKNMWEPFLHMDADAIITRRLLEYRFTSNLVYIANTQSDYLSTKYINSKGDGLLELMCKEVGISIAAVIANDKHVGGAQYIFNTEMTASLFKKIELDSVKLYRLMEDTKSQFIAKDGSTIQTWTALMWSILWNLWRINEDTLQTTELGFTWPTTNISEWTKHPFYHNAGVTKELADKGFFHKAKYMHEIPVKFTSESIIKDFCTFKYAKLVEQAWQ